MPKLGRKTPCAECPFRRDSIPGWLGAEKDPKQFVLAAEADRCVHPLPCHMKIDYSDPDWQETQYPDSDFCAGALIYAANQCKLPWEADRAEAVRSVEESDAVFTYPHEFVEHHGGELDDRIRYIKDIVEAKK